MAEKETRSTKMVTRMVPLLVAISLAAGACVGTVASPQATGSPAATDVAQPSSTATPASSSTTYDPSSEPIVQVVEKVTPSVVTVTARTQGTGNFFGSDSTRTSVGTGFVVRPDGVILTNDHVIDGASTITVTLPSGRELSARVLATDQDHDLAVLKVDAQNLAAVTLGDSSKIAVGQRVIAIGYALDLDGGPTVTSGIISSLARTIQVQDSSGSQVQPSARTYRDVLQTDAALNAGNSGGPLVTLDGDVIGIDSAGSNDAENIGFAIAINAAKPLIEQALGS
jgi:serine protease Do